MLKFSISCHHTTDTKKVIISITADDHELAGSSFYRKTNDIEEKFGEITWTYFPKDLIGEITDYEHALQLINELKESGYSHWDRREIVILDHREFSNITDSWKIGLFKEESEEFGASLASV
jgi:hypothetical protein